MLSQNIGRYFLSTLILFVYALILAYTTRSVDSNGLFYFLPVFFVGIPVVSYLMGLIWYYDFSFQIRKRKGMFDDEIVDTEKRKRDRLDNVLRDLSDEDLLILRKRLQDSSIDDDILYKRPVGDDGEIINRYNDN